MKRTWLCSFFTFQLLMSISALAQSDTLTAVKPVVSIAGLVDVY